MVNLLWISERQSRQDPREYKYMALNSRLKSSMKLLCRLLEFRQFNGFAVI